MSMRRGLLILAVLVAAPGLFATPALGATPALAAAHATVTGKVLDAAGQPLGAATVYLLTQHPTTGEAAEFGRGQTNPEGAFALPAPPTGKEPARLGVLAVKEGYGTWGTAIEPKGSRSGLEIRLPLTTELTGTVHDRAGRPLPGVRVRVTHGSWSSWFSLPERLGVLATVTDAAGRFRLMGVAVEAQLSLGFQRPGYARWGQHVRVADRPRVAVRLRKAARIAGRVIYEGTRRPAAGIRVSCRQEERAPAGYVAFGRAVTDRTGRFRFDDLWPGSYLVQLDYTVLGVATPAAVQWVALDREVKAVKEGGAALCPDLVLTRGGFVTGKVADRETGAPLSETRVSAHRVEQGQWRPGPGTKTGPDGTYRLRVPPGKWRVQAEWREGYLPPWQDRQERPQPNEVTVLAGKSVAGPRFTLQQGAEVKGVVLAPDGRPDPLATLTGPYMGEQKVQPDGSFTLSGLRADRPMTLTVSGADRALKAMVEVTPRKGTSEPVTVRLERCVAVTGKLVDEKGQPLKNAEVRAEVRVDLGDGSWMMPAMDRARADAAGQFTLRLLPGVEHEVKATAEGYGEVRKPGFVAPETGADLGLLTLAGANRSITGRVTDLDGKPISGVRVNVWGEGQASHRPQEVVTDAAGRYRFTGLAAGKVQVNIQHPATGFDYRGGVETGTTRVDFVLVPEQDPRTDGASPEPRLKPGDPAPEIAVAQWLGGQRGPRLKDLRGRIVVLQFACAYNPAVEATTARLEALRQRYGSRGVTFLSIYDASVPAGELAAYTKARASRHAIGLVAASPQLGWNSAVFRSYGVQAVPGLFVVDRKGRIRAVNPSAAELEQEIQRLTRRR